MEPVVLAWIIGTAGGVYITAMLLAIPPEIGHRGTRRERLVDRRVVRDAHLAPLFGNAISDWERVLTVKPVHTLDNGWVFCRYVWRRRIAKHCALDGGPDFWFQYLVKLQYVYE